MQAARHILPDLPDITLDFPVHRSVPKQASQSGFHFSRVLIAILIVGAAAFANVYQKALVVQNGINIARLQYRTAEDIRTGKDLRVEQMLLSSPARIERLASRALDMRKPEQVHSIVLPPSLSQPGTPRERIDQGGYRVTALVP